MIISEQFLKSIPLECKQNIISKLDRFENELLRCENKIRELPAGYWVRNVKNTDVFKFRLNNKDRILFAYINKREDLENEGSDILFLSYVNHDKQIRKGNSLDVKNAINKAIEINESHYIEDDIDNSIESDVINNFNMGAIDMNQIPSIVVSSEDLKLLADGTNEDYLYYLSDEQYDVIKALDNPVLLSGAAGTGKTVVLVNVLELARKNKEKALYVSYNKLLVDHTQTLYNKFNKEEDSDFNSNFYSIRELEGILNRDTNQIITNREMIKWVEENVCNYKCLKNKDIYEIVTEIKGVVKGYLGLEYSEVADISKLKKLSLDKYLNIPKQYSSFEEEEKHLLYKLTEAYDKWLSNNNFWDENDVARKIILDNSNFKKYNWVIVDEVQDLSEVQIYMLSKLVKDGGHIIWAGDINQTINPTFFNYGRIKNLYFTYNNKLNDFHLSKNYRSTKEITSLINEITNAKIKMIGKSKYDTFENAIREGNKPLVLKFNDDDIKNLIDTIADKHYCAIVVPNEEEKQRIINNFSEVEGRVFVVHEIKGLEYENIICYNILSCYSEIWKSIFNCNCKHNDKMRYYFNLLYVAISRAKERLSIYEEDMQNLKFNLFDECVVLDSYDSKAIGLDKKSTNADWEYEADRLERVGQDEKSNFIRNKKLEKFISDINKRIDKSFEKAYEKKTQEVVAVDKLDEELTPGIIKYRNRNYSGALEVFNELIEKYPSQSKLYYYLANTYGYMTGGMEYSIKYFKEAIELDENQYEYYLDMAAILKALRRYDDAIKVLDVANEMFPNLGNAKNIQASIYDDMGKFSKAQTAFRLSNIYPKYKWDALNKVWQKPEIKKDEKNICNNSTNNIISSPSMPKLPKGIEYIKIFNDNNLKECIEGIEFISSIYNKKTKRYTIEFSVNVCKSCNSFEECIASKMDDKNKVSIKELAIKHLAKLSKNTIKQKEETIKPKSKACIIQQIKHDESVYDYSLFKNEENSIQELFNALINME